MSPRYSPRRALTAIRTNAATPPTAQPTTAQIGPLATNATMTPARVRANQRPMAAGSFAADDPPAARDEPHRYRVRAHSTPSCRPAPHCRPAGGAATGRSRRCTWSSSTGWNPGDPAVQWAVREALVNEKHQTLPPPPDWRSSCRSASSLSIAWHHYPGVLRDNEDQPDHGRDVSAGRAPPTGLEPVTLRVSGSP